MDSHLVTILQWHASANEEWSYMLIAFGEKQSNIWVARLYLYDFIIYESKWAGHGDGQALFNNNK